MLIGIVTAIAIMAAIVSINRRLASDDTPPADTPQDPELSTPESKKNEASATEPTERNSVVATTAATHSTNDPNPETATTINQPSESK